MMGVDYDLFWTLNPKSLEPFIKAFDLRTKHEDSLCWQQGVYFRLAVASVMDKHVKYPSAPLMNKKNNVKSPEQIQKEVKESMLLRMAVLNNRFRKGE